MRYRFPEQARIRRRQDFSDIYGHGVRLRVFPLRVSYLIRPDADGSRLGLAVGRKTGCAVLRNRWKRGIREAFRQHRCRLSKPCDIVVSVSWNADRKDVAKTEEAFLKVVSIINNA